MSDLWHTKKKRNLVTLILNQQNRISARCAGTLSGSSWVIAVKGTAQTYGCADEWLDVCTDSPTTCSEDFEGIWHDVNFVIISQFLSFCQKNMSQWLVCANVCAECKENPSLHSWENTSTRPKTRNRDVSDLHLWPHFYLSQLVLKAKWASTWSVRWLHKTASCQRSSNVKQFETYSYRNYHNMATCYIYKPNI